MDPNDKIVLHYFPVNARGTLIRCMLDVSKVPYENKIISMEEWNSMEKPIEIYEYSFLPVLEYNEHKLSQCRAIQLFLAKKLGWFGSSACEEYEILNIIESEHDWFVPMAKFLFSMEKASKEEIEKQFKEFNTELIPWIFGVLEKKFVNKKGKYWVGDKLSLADIYASFLFVFFTHPTRAPFKETAYKTGPKLLAYGEELSKGDLAAYFQTGKFIKDAFY